MRAHTFANKGSSPHRDFELIAIVIVSIQRAYVE
jgi:hypothetical protein